MYSLPERLPLWKMVFQGPGGLFGSGYLEVVLKDHIPLLLILFQGNFSPPRRVFHLERAGGQCFTNVSCLFSGFGFIRSATTSIKLSVHHACGWSLEEKQSR